SGGGSDRTQVQGKKFPVDSNEYYRLQNAQRREQQAKVEQVVNGHEYYLSHHVPWFLLEQEANAEDQERECSKHLQWEDEVSLVFHDEARQPSLTTSLFFSKG